MIREVNGTVHVDGFSFDVVDDTYEYITDLIAAAKKYRDWLAIQEPFDYVAAQTNPYRLTEGDLT